MGLFNRRQPAVAEVLKGAVHWQVALVLLIVCLAFWAFGDEGRETFMYDRLQVENGEYWRLVTGHFVHLGTSHLLLNLAGLVLVWLLVGRYYSNAQWLLVVGITLATVSVCFWFIDRGLIWYVGLSGVLHGFLLAGAIRGYRTLPSESAIIVLIVVAKLGYEQLAGPLPGSESVSGGAVVVNAHLFGGIGGVIAALLLWRSAGDKPSI